MLMQGEHGGFKQNIVNISLKFYINPSSSYIENRVLCERLEEKQGDTFGDFYHKLGKKN